MTSAKIPKDENEKINARLTALYQEYTPDFLRAWSDAFEQTAPCRINEFGIIDVDRYDADNGILFIGRETNGWENEEYQNGTLFREWMCDISRNGIRRRGKVSRHPNMWYNIGRWTMLLHAPETPIDSIAYEKDLAIDAIGTIAFTNLNKVRGGNVSGEKYKKLICANTVQALLKKEVEIIQPKIIVACGTYGAIASCLADCYQGTILSMCHPAARKSSKDMLQALYSTICAKET